MKKLLYLLAVATIFAGYTSAEIEIHPALIVDDIKNTQCNFATVGHLYSITSRPKILKHLAEQLNAENFDAVVFTGDLTIDGKDKNWELINNFFSTIKSKLLFVPGNHDLMNKEARENWNKHVGYLSKKISIKECNFILLNSTNSLTVDYEWDKIVPGNGIDDPGIEILKQMKANTTNLLFMHHTLYSSDLWKVDHGYQTGDMEKNALLQEKKWNEYVLPYLHNKVKLVYAGDWHSRIVSITIHDGIVYVANGLARMAKSSKQQEQLSYTTTYVKNNGVILNRIIPLTIPK